MRRVSTARVSTRGVVGSEISPQPMRRLAGEPLRAVQLGAVPDVRYARAGERQGSSATNNMWVPQPTTLLEICLQDEGFRKEVFLQTLGDGAV